MNKSPTSPDKQFEKSCREALAQGTLAPKDFQDIYSLAQPGLINSTTTTGTTAAASTTPNDPHFYNTPFTNTDHKDWGAGTAELLQPKEKETLVKTGFKFNKETRKWELTMTATVEIPTPEGVFAFIGGGDGEAVDRAIEAFKKLKDKILNKLTAKVVFMELTKPREVKE